VPNEVLVEATFILFTCAFDLVSIRSVEGHPTAVSGPKARAVDPCPKAPVDTFQEESEGGPSLHVAVNAQELVEPMTRRRLVLKASPCSADNVGNPPDGVTIANLLQNMVDSW
jgi:hypothetical protein